MLYCGSGFRLSPTTTTAGIGIPAMSAANLGPQWWHALVVGHLIVATLSLGALVLAMLKLAPVCTKTTWASSPVRRELPYETRASRRRVHRRRVPVRALA